MYEEEIRLFKAAGLYRKLRTVESPHGRTIRVRGRRMLSFSSNDYLGLAAHPLLREAAAVAVQRYGTGTGASRLLSGTTVLHSELEEELASFLGCEKALIFNSGYAANTGILSALCGREDLILSDTLNHASIVDGCRLSKADVKVYNHCDCNQLEDILKVSGKYKRRWIVTDSLFSMEGDLAPLQEIVELTERYGASIYLDEAHAVGVLGKEGRGAASLFGVDGRISLRMGTFGKAFGSFGAFVAGDASRIDYLINRARSFIYSTSLPPAVLAASSAALKLIRAREGEILREKLRSNTTRLVRGLNRFGVVKGDVRTPIVPLILGSSERALLVSSVLDRKGIFAPAIRPPTVPEGFSRIRFSVMATHHGSDLGEVIEGVETALGYSGPAGRERGASDEA